MIKVISPQSGDEYFQIMIAQLSVPILVGPASAFKTFWSNPPVDLGHLDQGPVVDEFGNKFVEHVDLSGELVMLGTDMSYKPTTAWPVCNLTGNGFTIGGYKRSSPTKHSSYRGCAFVDGSFGSAVLGGAESPDLIKGWSGYSNYNLSWDVSGCTIDITVTGEGYQINTSKTQWVKSIVVSHTRLTLDLTKNVVYVLESRPGNMSTYYDGRVSNVVEIPAWSSYSLNIDWLMYDGVSPTLTSTLGISSVFSVCMEDTLFKYFNTNPVWAELCQKAILSGQYVDCNMIAMINDLKNLRVDLTSILESAKKLPLTDLMTKKGWKEISSFFLGNNYGYQLTYSDAQSIGGALERLRQNIKRGQKEIQKLTSASKTTLSGRVPLTVDCHYTAKVGTSNDPLMQGIKGLFDWDLYPSLGNMWDLIPYSFCVDWVVGLGDLFETIDANAYMRYYQAKSIMKSTKISTGPVNNQQILGSLPGACGLVSYTHYRRWVEYSFDPMPLSVDFHPSELLGHWVEGASLIIQRT
nr:MAG: putative maturation protein [StochSRVP_12 levi-like virus]